MGIFDDIRNAEWRRYADSEVVEIAWKTLGVALECAVDQHNHLPIPHPAVARHYAEEASASYQRCFIDDRTADALQSAMENTELVLWASRMPLTLPASKCLIVVGSGHRYSSDVFAVQRLHDDNVVIFAFHFYNGVIFYDAVMEGEWSGKNLDIRASDKTKVFRVLDFFAALSASLQIPRMTLVDDVIHSHKLQRARLKRGVAPLLSYNTVSIPFAGRGIKSTRRIDELCGSRKSLHHVREFWRTIVDYRSPTGLRRVFVPDHWRGSPEIGIRITERHFE